MKVIKSLRAPVLVTLVLLLICGLIYPVVMTLMSQALFPSQANGSIIYVDGQAVGAKNVGQDFTDPRFINAVLWSSCKSFKMPPLRDQRWCG